MSECQTGLATSEYGRLSVINAWAPGVSRRRSTKFEGGDGGVVAWSRCTHQAEDDTVNWQETTEAAAAAAAAAGAVAVLASREMK